MDPIALHRDRSLDALVHGTRLPRLAAPSGGVTRRLFERDGGEVARATSLVRYVPGARFAEHVHDRGEEFLVIEGVFADQRGRYPAGTYVRNPPGSRHAPFSDEGCVIFVKLRQMAAGDRDAVVVHEADRRWAAGAASGHQAELLHAAGGERVSLESLAPGARLPAREAAGGEELFVISGVLRADDGAATELEAGSWWRRAGALHPALVSAGGALWWTKRGHLAGER